MLNVDKVYVVHYTKLYDRKKRMDSILESLNIEAEYITSFDQEKLDKKTVLNIYKSRSSEFDKKIRPMYGTNYRRLSKAEISCIFKHREAIKKISTGSGNYGLVLEDDVVLANDFENSFNSYLEQTPADWDIVFMGNCCGLHVPSHRIEEGVIAYKMTNPASKCTDSYLIKKDASKRFVSSMRGFPTAPADYDLSYHISYHNLNAYWWEPTLVEQGSQNGLYGSSIQ